MKKNYLDQNKESGMLKLIFIIPIILMFLCVNLWMQQPDAMKLTKQFNESSKANMGMMLQYSWKMRIELTLKGETKPEMLYQMRFDVDRKLQKTLISAPVKQKKRRGLRKQIAKKKIGEAKEWAAKVMQIHKRYTNPSEGTMLDFFNKAKFQAMNDGTLQVQVKGFLQADDTATFWFDQQSHQPRRFKFTTSLEGAAVEGLVEYAKVAFGPTYAGRTTLKVPAKKVSAKIENFDFIKQ